MAFDPFGDFEERGCLRNFEGFKTASAVKRFEHREHAENRDAAFANIQTYDRIEYDAIRGTHAILFGSVYPWAGQDRLSLTPYQTVGKAGFM